MRCSETEFPPRRSGQVAAGREEQRLARKQELERLLQRYHNVKLQVESQQKVARQRHEKDEAARALGGLGARQRDRELRELKHAASKQRRAEFEAARMEHLRIEREEAQAQASYKKALSQRRLALNHSKIKGDYNNSSHRLRQQRLAKISESVRI